MEKLWKQHYFVVVLATRFMDACGGSIPSPALYVLLGLALFRFLLPVRDGFQLSSHDLEGRQLQHVTNRVDTLRHQYKALQRKNIRRMPASLSCNCWPVNDPALDSRNCR